MKKAPHRQARGPSDNTTDDDTGARRILLGGCGDCFREWSALSEAHCAGCCSHFTSDKAFDRHLNRPDAPDDAPACFDPATIKGLYLNQRASGPAWSTEPPSEVQMSTFPRVSGRATTDA